MIDNQVHQYLKNAWILWNQLQNKGWNASRAMALNYYHGITEDFTKEWYSEKTRKKGPMANTNITGRIIKRTSLVYMLPPVRTVSDGGDKRRPVDKELYANKDIKMQRLERWVNLLQLEVIGVTTRGGKLEHDLITRFVPVYADDPLNPIGITFPIQSSKNNNGTVDMWQYWDDEVTFDYNSLSNLQVRENQRDNPYGVSPYLYVFRDGKPEEKFLGVDIDWELVNTNLAVNLNETNKDFNIQFQSFGWAFASGPQLPKILEVGPDKITRVGDEGEIGMVSPPNTVEAIEAGINGKYKRLAQNHGLPVQFVEGTTAESGISIRLRNQELQDERTGDIPKYRKYEKELFELEKIVADVDLGKNLGEDFNVDFNESVEILSVSEQDAHDKNDIALNIIDTADILIRRDPDKFKDRDAALDHLVERGMPDPRIVVTPVDNLVAALAGNATP